MTAYLFFCSVSLMGQAHTHEALFEKGLEAEEKQDYQGAVDYFKSAIEAGAH